MEGGSGRQRQRRTNIERTGAEVEGMRETLWERQRRRRKKRREGGRDEGCCILVIAQTEAAGADRGMERIDERGRN